MTLLVDTSVWSLALRRDTDATGPEVQALKDALFGNDNDVEKSDTWHFIHDYLRTLPTDALHDPGLARMLGEFIDNNRFAIMSADGRLTVVNRDQGVETHGIWFSNTYAWRPDTLMPAYRQMYAERPYKEYYDSSAWGLLDHDDTEDAPDVAMLRASVADEVHEAMGSLSLIHI